MDSSNQGEFKAQLTRLIEMYRHEISGELTKIYWESLKVMTIDQMKQAVQDHIQDTDHGMFFPKPANLLRAVYGDTKSRESEASQAWLELQKQLRAHTASIGDKTKTAIEGCGGTYALKRMSTYDMAMFKREFMCNYTAVLVGELPLLTQLEQKRI